MNPRIAFAGRVWLAATSLLLGAFSSWSAPADNQSAINELQQAFSRNDETAVSDLLQQNTNLCNAAIWWSRLPLLVATEKGWNDVVDLLLKNGANPNAEGDVWSTSNAQMTALEVAIQFNRLNIFKRLLTAGADPNHRSNFHGPALNEAFGRHREEMASLLLARGANPFLEDMSYWKRTPIELDITSADGKLVAEMLKTTRMKKEKKSSFLAAHGHALLTAAATRGELEAVEALLAENVAPVLNSTNELTVLQAVSRAFADASNSKNFDAARWAKIHALLQKAGGKDDAFSATGFGDLAAARNFAKANPYAAQATDNEGQGLLHWSVLTGQLPFTDFWIESGTPVDATNAAGQTPLDLAAQPRFGGPPISFWINQLMFSFGPPDVFHRAMRNQPVLPPARKAVTELLEQAGAKHGEKYSPNGMPGMMIRGGIF